MSASTKGSGMAWVGRSIRRLEDQALLTGQGRFTADPPAAHWVRVARSPIASGRIERIEWPPRSNVITAADLEAVKPIKPMLHKFSNACHVAEAADDVETGRVAVAEVAGSNINPMIVGGQVHGGIAQGIGNALLEEIVYDESGDILTSTLAEYLPSTAPGIAAIELHHMETCSEACVAKAKGVDECGTIGAPAVVINAVNDAIAPFGVSIDEIPATSRKIRAALRRTMEQRA